MPSNTTGVYWKSLCSRNASISSIRKSLPPKGVKDREQESIVRPEVEVGLPLSEISKRFSITNFEGPDWSSCLRDILVHREWGWASIKARAVHKKGLPNRTFLCWPMKVWQGWFTSLKQQRAPNWDIRFGPPEVVCFRAWLHLIASHHLRVSNGCCWKRTRARSRSGITIHEFSDQKQSKEKNPGVEELSGELVWWELEKVGGDYSGVEENREVEFGLQPSEVVLPPNAKVVKSKWIYKKKTDMDGKVYIYKARLVAKGFTQTYGVDYEETFSPVADIRAIRILIAIAAYYDYEIWQMDVKTAFLNGFLEEEIYMEQPEGFIDPNHPSKVCKLQRSIYGLKQASRSWNKRFDEEIKKSGFHQNLDEPCVYQKASGSNVTFLIDSSIVYI
ncbi:retrotransposon protein, putative, ty1-copia subclass [Tanacetum coccineum]